MTSAPEWTKPAESTSQVKPKKVWQVGDKVFLNYLDAVRATTPIRRSAERADFIEVVQKALNAASHRDVRNDAEQIADALLAVYTIKPIKK